MGCPICKNDNWKPFLVAANMYSGAMHAIARCAGCGLARTEGDLASPDQLYVYDGGSDAGTRFGAIQWMLQILRRARVRRFVRQRTGRALDVGCGDGSFLHTLMHEGWDVVGTELSESIATTAKRRLGDKVRVGPIEQADLPGASFDLVTFWHVLEHLDDPLTALAEARRLVKPEGCVVVAVPNLDSLQAQIFKHDWLHLDVPRHRWHFGVRNLTTLAEQCHLRILRIHHFSLEYGPFGIIQGVATKVGLGHALFTRLVRLPPSRLLREPLFWIHLPLIAISMVPSILLELYAAAVDRGGALVMILQPTAAEGTACSRRD